MVALNLSLVSPAVQHKDTSSPVNMGSGTSASSLAGDFLTPPASADVAADIAKYTTKVSPIFSHFWCKYCSIKQFS